MGRSEPFEFNLPHQEWRPHQFEAVQRVLEMEEGDTLIVQADTGSGKTAYATAAGIDLGSIAVMKTKMLQQQNYAEGYGFSYMFGRANYRCLVNRNASAALCQYAEDPTACMRFSTCPYHARKAKVKRAKLVALNYAYYMTARWPRNRAPDGYLFLDECHELSSIVVERSSVTIDADTRAKWGLPAFPSISSKEGGMLFGGESPTQAAAAWLDKARARVKARLRVLRKQALVSSDALKKMKAAESLYWRIDGTRSALASNPADWFIRSGPHAREARGRRLPGFVCKPLTARHHFPGLFLHGGRTVLMSATVGNFETFAAELGIEGHDTLRVPSQWPPSARPVYYDPEAPRIGYKSPESAFDKQADIIAKMLSEVPSNWAGVIHCKQKARARALAGRLAARGLGERVWVPPRLPSDKQLLAWRAARKKHPGRIAIAWSWWMGVDMLDEKIAIVAKTPYPFIGSDYARARMYYDGSFYLQRTAWKLQQGCGRTRRGRPQDYDKDGERAGLVAIIDGNWTRVRKYMDDSFRESMTAW